MIVLYFLVYAGRHIRQSSGVMEGEDFYVLEHFVNPKTNFPQESPLLSDPTFVHNQIITSMWKNCKCKPKKMKKK